MRAVRPTGVLVAPQAAAEQVTELLTGDRVDVHEARGDWIRVTVAAQPSSKDPSGYPGWVARADLAHDDEAVVAIARGYLGTPYVWGGLTTDGIDCSGLVHMSLRACGVMVPRDAFDQAQACESVELGSERPGDLWFFAGAGPGARITHVGFVVEPRDPGEPGKPGVMLHAPDSGPRRFVVEEPLPEDRVLTLVAAGRFAT